MIGTVTFFLLFEIFRYICFYFIFFVFFLREKQFKVNKWKQVPALCPAKQIGSLVVSLCFSFLCTQISLPGCKDDGLSFVADKGFISFSPIILLFFF
jgi:hypothetical protein